jgi:hypothetical protein
MSVGDRSPDDVSPGDLGPAGLPPGFGPVLVSARPVPKRLRARTAVQLGLFFAALAAYYLWIGTPWPWVAGPFIVTYALLIWVSFTEVVRAGQGWLGSGKQYVRTDQLSQLQARDTTTGTRVQMRDADGRTLDIRESDLLLKPEIWSLVRQGVVASCAAGVAVDARTARCFGVPATPRPPLSLGRFARRRVHRFAQGGWYYPVVLLSVGILSFVPFLHAALRLRTARLWLWTGFYAAAVAIALIVTRTTGGAASGATGSTNSARTAEFVFGLAVFACLHLTSVRRQVWPPHACRGNVKGR